MRRQKRLTQHELLMSARLNLMLARLTMVDIEALDRERE